jgi:hypothetical protein
METEHEPIGTEAAKSHVGGLACKQYFQSQFSGNMVIRQPLKPLYDKKIPRAITVEGPHWGPSAVTRAT